MMRVPTFDRRFVFLTTASAEPTNVIAKAPANIQTFNLANIAFPQVSLTYTYPLITRLTIS